MILHLHLHQRHLQRHLLHLQVLLRVLLLVLLLLLLLLLLRVQRPCRVLRHFLNCHQNWMGVRVIVRAHKAIRNTTSDSRALQHRFISHDSDCINHGMCAGHRFGGQRGR